MQQIARDSVARHCPRALDALPPAPTSTMLRLLGLLRRPVPASEMRSVAADAGLTEDETEAAIRTATRRQVIGLALVGSSACYVRRRP
jgi:hypothetical protein